MKVMDVTTAHELGAELATAIENEIGYSQSIIIHEMPSVLVLTPKQHASLMEYSGLPTTARPRFFKTKYNIMELEVKQDD